MLRPLVRLRRAGLTILTLALSLPLANARNIQQPGSPIDQLIARDNVLQALKSETVRLTPLNIRELAACTPKPLSAPATIQGNLSALSCYDAVINSYEDIYNLSGVAGQTVHIDFSSTAFETFLYMEAVHTDYVSHISTSGISRHTIDYTFPTTRTYKLEVETLYGPGDSSAHSGPYTLVVSTGGSPSPGGCSQNATTICLSGDRFAVSATWRSTDGSNGSGQAVRLTSDTGYFTFFNASNVEVVVKVLNGCGLNSRYWVFAGGLTNVNVVLTIRDTTTGTTKTYTNPQSTAFQPIQDTGALATCP